MLTRLQWMLHSQDSLHSGPFSPVTLGAPDITTLLPCNEEDFAAGRQPRSRAALPDSPPAIERPLLVRDPGRSLFASLMQIHHYWGTVSRRAATFAREAAPWDNRSEFCNMKTKLDDWEEGLPPTHHWSKPQLQHFKKRGLDLVRCLSRPGHLAIQLTRKTGIPQRYHDASSVQHRPAPTLSR